MQSTSSIEMKQRCSRTWHSLILIRFVLRKTHTKSHRLRSEPETCDHSVSVSSKMIEKPVFFCNTDHHHLVSSFSYAFQRLAAQGSDEIEKFWKCDSNQYKSVQNSGATEPKTQPSRKSDGICRWLYCWLWETRLLYPLPANGKESSNRITGTLWTLL